jgi:TrmH family RNA methyltransferase
MATLITSAQNERLRDLQRLEKRSVRDERRLTVVEGARETSRCLAAGVIPQQAFVCREIAIAGGGMESLALLEELDRQRRTHLFEITADLYAKVAVRENSGGVLLVIPYLTRVLEDLPRVANPFYAVIEGVE